LTGKAFCSARYGYGHGGKKQKSGQPTLNPSIVPRARYAASVTARYPANVLDRPARVRAFHRAIVSESC
jgi:hypothetical protein